MPGSSSPPPRIDDINVTEVRENDFDIEAKVYAPLYTKAPTDSGSTAWSYFQSYYEVKCKPTGGVYYTIPWASTAFVKYQRSDCELAGKTYAGGYITFTADNIPKGSNPHLLRIERDLGWHNLGFDV